MLVRSALLFTFIVCWPKNVSCLPERLTVVAGDAEMQLSDSSLTINCSKDAILHWDSFQIAKNELLHFQQESAHRAVLNRVLGNDPSTIFGRLTSNGSVYLINPNGVLIGPDASIASAGFIASTLNFPDVDFLAKGDLHFFGDSQKQITHLGKINCLMGDVFLIAHTVDNQGVISAPQGHVGIASGTDILLQVQGNERIFIRTEKIVDESSEATAISNSGQIEALSVDLQTGGCPYAKAIRSSGKIDALGIEDKGGVIRLVAQNGACSVSGTLKAQKEDQGGTIHVLGDCVSLTESALLDSSAVADGGTILIGGDYQGKNTEILNARYNQIAKGAKIMAHSKQVGHGGKVIIWADELTEFSGFIDVQGGPQSGNGGFIEVSGKKNLSFSGFADRRAPFGSPGTLLLDPVDVIIGGSDSPCLLTGGGIVHPSIAGACTCGSTFSISSASLEALLAAGSVSISTSASCEFPGNIHFTSGITWAQNNTLSLNAAAAVIIDAGVTISNTYTGTSFDAVYISPPLFGGTTKSISHSGTISTVDGNVNVNIEGDLGISIAGTVQATGNGTISLINTSSEGITFSGSSLISTATGAITITSTASSIGVSVSDNSIIRSTSGGITVSGTADTGVVLEGSASISTLTTGAISVTGTGANGPGILCQSGATLASASASGNLHLSGVSTNGTGLFLNAAGAISSTNAAAILLDGAGKVGVQFSGDVTLTNSSSGATTITGVGSTYSVLFTSASTGTASITTVNTDLSIIGTGAMLGGIFLDNYNGTIAATGTGGVNLMGIGADGPAISLTSPAGLTLSTNSGTLACTGTASFGDSLYFNKITATSTSGDINLTGNSTVTTGWTANLINSTVQTSGGGSLAINGAHIGGSTATTPGIHLSGSSLLHGTGTGTLSVASSNGPLVFESSATVTHSGSGATTLSGTGVLYGIQMSSNPGSQVLISVANGNLNINGTTSNGGTGSAAILIYDCGGSITSSGLGTLNLTGTHSSSAGDGIRIQPLQTFTIQDSSGAGINITGQSGSSNTGVILNGTRVFSNAGSGVINITGTGLTALSTGILINGGSTVGSLSASPTVRLTANATVTSSTSNSIRISDLNTFISTGGTISFVGPASPKQNPIFITDEATLERAAVVSFNAPTSVVTLSNGAKIDLPSGTARVISAPGFIVSNGASITSSGTIALDFTINGSTGLQILSGGSITSGATSNTINAVGSGVPGIIVDYGILDVNGGVINGSGTTGIILRNGSKVNFSKTGSTLAVTGTGTTVGIDISGSTSLGDTLVQNGAASFSGNLTLTGIAPSSSGTVGIRALDNVMIQNISGSFTIQGTGETGILVQASSPRMACFSGSGYTFQGTSNLSTGNGISLIGNAQVLADGLPATFTATGTQGTLSLTSSGNYSPILRSVNSNSDIILNSSGYTAITAGVIQSQSAPISITGVGLSGSSTAGITIGSSANVTTDQGSITLNGTGTVGYGISVLGQINQTSTSALSSTINLTGSSPGTGAILISGRITSLTAAQNIISTSNNIAISGGTLSTTGSLFNITINTAGQTLLTNSNILLNSSSVAFTGPVQALGTEKILSSQFPGITFNSTLDGPGSLQATGPAPFGILTLIGAVGATTPLSSLTLQNGNIDQRSTVQTTGDITYTGDSTALIRNNITSGTGDITFNVPLTLLNNVTIQSTSGNIYINNSVDGNRNLTLNSGSGTLNIFSSIGKTTPISVFSATGSAINVKANIQTQGGMTFNSPVALVADPLFIDTSVNGLTFSSAITGNADLILQAPNGPIQMNSTVNLTASGANGANLTATAGGNITFAGAITTSGGTVGSGSGKNGGNVSISSTSGSVQVAAITASGSNAVSGLGGNGGNITLQPNRNFTSNSLGTGTKVPNGILSLFGDITTSGGTGTSLAGVGGSVFLSPYGRSSLMSTATIVGNPSGSNLQITANQLQIGSLEAMTILGSITFNTTTAILGGDIVGLDSVSITSPTILTALRSAAPILNSSGTLYNSDGVHALSSGPFVITGGQFSYELGTAPNNGMTTLTADDLTYMGYILNFDSASSPYVPPVPPPAPPIDFHLEEQIVNDEVIANSQLSYYLLPILDIISQRSWICENTEPLTDQNFCAPFFFTFPRTPTERILNE